jgi:hypothetical protein
VCDELNYKLIYTYVVRAHIIGTLILNEQEKVSVLCHAFLIILIFGIGEVLVIPLSTLQTVGESREIRSGERTGRFKKRSCAQKKEFRRLLA